MQFFKILLVVIFSITSTTHANQTIIFDNLANRISQLNLINVSKKIFFQIYHINNCL